MMKKGAAIKFQLRKGLTLIFCCFVLVAGHCVLAQDSNVPTPTIMVTINQSFEKSWHGDKETLPGVQLPLESICTRILNAAGIKPVYGIAPSGKKPDGMMKVTFHGTALGGAYMISRFEEGKKTGSIIAQVPSYSGADIDGDIVMQYGNKSFTIKFKAHRPLPEIVDKERKAIEAPFAEILSDDGSFVAAVAAGIEAIWGRNTSNWPPLEREMAKLKSDLGRGMGTNIK